MQYIRVRLTNALSKPLYINRCIVATSDYPGTRNGYDFEFPAGAATFTRRLPKQTPQSFPLFVRFLPRPFPRFFASRRVAWCTRWISYGIFEIGTRWIVSYFFSFEWKRDWKRIRNLKRFFERVFCLFVCMICMVFSRFLLLEEEEECSEKFSILSIALRSFFFFYIGRVLWIFIEMENIGKYKYKFWSVKFYIFLQLLIDIRYLYNYKFLLSL